MGEQGHHDLLSAPWELGPFEAYVHLAIRDPLAPDYSVPWKLSTIGAGGTGSTHETPGRDRSKLTFDNYISTG